MFFLCLHVRLIYALNYYLLLTYLLTRRYLAREHARCNQIVADDNRRQQTPPPVRN